LQYEKGMDYPIMVGTLIDTGDRGGLPPSNGELGLKHGLPQ